MSNFYSTLFSNPTSAVAQDAKADKSEKCYLVTCRDADGVFLRLMNTIKKVAGVGHSFAVVVDSNSKDKETFFIDGDGSDRINSIVTFPGNSDLVGILLSNFNTIRWICSGALPNEDDPDKVVDDPIEALKTIRTSCDTLLDGHKYDFGSPTKDILKQIISICENKEVKPNENSDDIVERIKSYCEHELERKESAMKPEPSK